MEIAAIVLVLAFSSILCIVEIPKMLAMKLNRELWTFLILLVLGVALAILKSLNVSIPNPSDWIAWVYSPVSNVLKDFLK
jgi:hypothetical protein